MRLNWKKKTFRLNAVAFMLHLQMNDPRNEQGIETVLQNIGRDYARPARHYTINAKNMDPTSFPAEATRLEASM